MSMPQILATWDALVRDPDVGLAAKVEALALSNGADIRSDFNYLAWALQGQLSATQSPNVMMRPLRWLAQPKDGGQRDADAEIQFGYEYFGADLGDIQENVTLVSVAFAQVVDEFRNYSDRVGATFLELAGAIAYDFGQFAGPTSHGFLATITLTERSSQ